MAGFFQAIFHKDRKAINELHARAVHQSDRAVRAANRLQDTIREMVDENDRLTNRQPPHEKRSS
jgi:hypothetical protein